MKTKYDNYTNDNQVKMFENGQIFFMEDNHKRSDDVTSHMYLVMSDTTDDAEQMYNCMSITSRRNKSTEGFVPIAFNTYEISYIDPFNLYSFYESEFKLRSYRGVLTNDIINKYDLMDMLMDLFLIHNGFQPRINEAEVFKIYDKYLMDFYEKYNYLSEHTGRDSERKIINRPIISERIVKIPSENNQTVLKDGGFNNTVISGLDKIKIEDAIKQHGNKTILFTSEDISKQEPMKSKTNINYEVFLKRASKFTDSEIQLYIDIWKEKGSKWLNNKLGFNGTGSAYNKKSKLLKEAEKRGLVIK